MIESEESKTGARSVSGMIEILVRVSAIAALALWCFAIIQPFAGPMVWGMIVAVALAAPFERLEHALGGRSGAAAVVFVIVTLVLLIVPALQLSETLVSGARFVSEQIDAGALEVPPPPQKVADWPLIGDKVYSLWHLASQNLESALEQVGPQLKLASSWLISAAGAAGLGVALFFLSLIVSAVMLANRDSAAMFAHTLGRRLAGSRGDELVELARSTTVGVATGIVGVALIQSILAGIGFLFAGVPGAGLWAMLVLVAAVIQLPVALVLIPIVVFVFSHASTTVFVLFAIWATFVSLIDNFLKPLLFGRGARVPTLVIFVGAIGGMIHSGAIGLFSGAVVLAVGFELFRSWLYEDTTPEPESVQTEG